MLAAFTFHSRWNSSNNAQRDGKIDGAQSNARLHACGGPIAIHHPCTFRLPQMHMGPYGVGMEEWGKRMALYPTKEDGRNAPGASAEANMREWK